MPIPTSPQGYQSSWGDQLGPCRSLHHPGVTNPLEVINWIHADPNITPRLPILLGQSIGSMSIPTSPRGYQSPRGNQLDPCRSQHHPEVTNHLGAINWIHADPYITPGVTNPLWAINWIHADPNITLRLPIFLGQSIGSMPILTSPGGYQSSGGNQLDSCQSQYHHEVTNPLGTINWVHADPYITLGGTQLDSCRSQHHPEVTNPLEAINWVHVDPYITPGVTNPLGAISWIHVDPNITLRLPILWDDQLGLCRSLHYPRGYQSLRFNQLDLCRSQHHLEATNPLGANNWVHVDPYITLGLSILWGPSIGSMPILTSSRSYQSSGAHQLDP
ncbi:hypothetical protein ACE6H2_025587 [Prunus campanulata]